MAETQIPLRYGPLTRSWLASNATSNSTTVVNLTGLQVAVTSGKTYRFKWFICYDANLQSTGVRFTVNGPGFSDINCSLEWTNQTNTYIKNFKTAYGAGTQGSNTFDTTGNMCWIEGVFTFSSSGNIYPSFNSDASSTLITIKGGYSFVEWQLLS